MNRRVLIFSAMLVLLGACDPSVEPATSGGLRQAISTPSSERVVLSELPFINGDSQPFLTAPWGEEVGSFARETMAAETGPMAITTRPEGGLAIVDTVGGRIYLYERNGERSSAIDSGVQTADDLIVADDGSISLLVYQRLPSPGYEIRTHSTARQEWSSPRPVSPEVTLPTGLFVDGARILVEQRHGWLHAIDGSSMLWGRPAGERRTIRALRAPDGEVELTAATRDGEPLWTRRVPGPITEILALESSDERIALVTRSITDESRGQGHEASLLLFDHDGNARCRASLRDSRITDSGRPFTLDNDSFYELTTDEDGVKVLRTAVGGGRCGL